MTVYEKIGYQLWKISVFIRRAKKKTKAVFRFLARR
jgi:hypothetical protein